MNSREAFSGCRGGAVRVFLLEVDPDLDRSARRAAARQVAKERIGEELGGSVEIVGEGAEVMLHRAGPGGGDTGLPALSFSYCAGWAAVAFGPVDRLGVDIELSGSVRERIIDRVMAPELRERIPGGRSGDGDSAATRSWTVGEAIGKAEGSGLSALLDRRGEPHLLAQLWDRHDFAVEDLDLGVTCAIATSRGGRPEKALRDLTRLADS